MWHGRLKFRTALIAGLLLLFAMHVRAAAATVDIPPPDETAESVVKLPVSVSLRDGSLAAGEMLLTIFKPAGTGPFPIAIINHGRSSSHRDTPARVRMQGIARYLARQGFAVFVPTRLGYGQSYASIEGQADKLADPEDSGDCSDKNYRAALEPAVQQIVATLSYARQQSYTDNTRHLVVGQSMGGLASAAYAATQPVGLMGYVNFAGGLGGNPLEHPGVPCQPERLTQAYAEFGKSTRAPSLWIYTENDQFFGPNYSRAWHRAFAAGGSPTQFSLQAPFSNDGHKLLSEGLTLWRPLMDAFLGKLGVHALPAPETPPASGYASIQDLGRIPWLYFDAKLRGYTPFLAASRPRAFAISQSGNWGWAGGQEQAVALALANCNRVSIKPCVLYAVDDAVVWRPKEPPRKAP